MASIGDWQLIAEQLQQLKIHTEICPYHKPFNTHFGFHKELL